MGFHIIQFGVDYFPRSPRHLDAVVADGHPRHRRASSPCLYRDVRATRAVAGAPDAGVSDAGVAIAAAHRQRRRLRPHRPGVSRAILTAAERRHRHQHLGAGCRARLRGDGALAARPRPASASVPTSPPSGRTRRCSRPARSPRSSTARRLQPLVAPVPAQGGGRPGRSRRPPPRVHRPARARSAARGVTDHPRRHPPARPPVADRRRPWSSRSPPPPASSAVRIIRIGGTVAGRRRRHAGSVAASSGAATAAGFRWPATATGLDEAGHLAGDRLVAAIDRLGAGRRRRRPSWPPIPARPTTPISTATGGATGGPTSSRPSARRQPAPPSTATGSGSAPTPIWRRREPARAACPRRLRRPRLGGSRFHTAVRARTCPFAELETRTPRDGRVLDVGCGHGLLALVLAVGSPDRQVLGVDVDRDKLPSAEAAARRAGVTNVTFEPSNPVGRRRRPSMRSPSATSSTCSVPRRPRTLLSDLSRALAPGGVAAGEGDRPGARGGSTNSPGSRSWCPPG